MVDDMKARFQAVLFGRGTHVITRVTEGRSSAIVRSWGRKKATNTRFVWGSG
jgi:hypothetical protein